MGMGGQLEKGLNIDGGTDSTPIGNVTDRLKVINSPSYQATQLQFLDMGVANGGVARDTSISSTTVYTTVLSRTGSGHLFSFLITLEGALTGGDPFNIKLEVDSVVVFEITTADIGGTALYNLVTAGDENTMGFSLDSNTFRFSAPGSVGLYYSSNITISIKKEAGGGKRFRAGLAFLTAET